MKKRVMAVLAALIFATCIFAFPPCVRAQECLGLPIELEAKTDDEGQLEPRDKTLYWDISSGEVLSKEELDGRAAVLDEGLVELNVGLRNENGYVGLAFIASGYNRVKIKAINGSGTLRDRTGGSGNYVTYGKSTLVPSSFFTLLKTTDRQIISGHRYTLSFTLTVDVVTETKGFSGVTDPTTL